MHPLLKTTVRSSAIMVLDHRSGSKYDFATGVWHGPNGPVCEDESTMPISKKNDIETGEDQKGQ